MVLSWLRGERKAGQEAAVRLYESVVAQARQPVFYTKGQVPDTLDGRFDMVSLHLILVLRCMKAREARDIAQLVLDTFLLNMDESLREIGVGDMSIGKRIKQMSSAFYGRVAAYEDGLKADDDEILIDALHRNLYRGAPAVDHSTLEAMAAYTRKTAAQLEAENIQDLMDGRVTFKETFSTEPV